jgi:hypothetical protein
VEDAPTRFTIRPDDYHVPYAGTAEDGRRFFTTRVDGTEFGWKVDRYADGTYFISIEPGDFICYYAPWDGHDYDT